MEIICRKKNVTFDYMKEIVDKVMIDESSLIIVHKPVHVDIFLRIFPETKGRIIYRSHRKRK